MEKRGALKQNKCLYLYILRRWCIFIDNKIQLSMRDVWLLIPLICKNSTNIGNVA